MRVSLELQKLTCNISEDKIVYMGFMAHQHQRSSPIWNYLWWLRCPVISRNRLGLNFPDNYLTVEEKPQKKSQPGKLTPLRHLIRSLLLFKLGAFRSWDAWGALLPLIYQSIRRHLLQILMPGFSNVRYRFYSDIDRLTAVLALHERKIAHPFGKCLLT